MISKGHMNEILFLVETALEGGFSAKAFAADIFTEADDLPSLHERVRGAVRCHFDAGQAPKLIRLHFTHDEVIAA